MRRFISKETPELQKQVLSKALIRMSEHMGISRRELGMILGVSKSSLSRFYEGKRFIDPKSKEGELTLILLRIYRSLNSLLGSNDQQSRLWLRSQNLHLGGIPIDLIQSIQGLITVVSYLDAMRGKV